MFAVPIEVLNWNW